MPKNIKHEKYIYCMKEERKKKYGEVLTPPTLVNEMLDKLPKEVWYDKDKKWLDPCAGRNGIFPIEVYKRLMVTLEDVIKDPVARDIHIWGNMLYMVELQDNAVEEMMVEIDNVRINKGGKVNIYHGSFLDNDFDKYCEDVWKV